MRRIDIAIQVGTVEQIEELRRHCARQGVRFCSLRPVAAAVWHWLLRVACRLADVVVSLGLLLTLFPVVYVVVAVVVKRRSPGPVVVREPACTAAGRPFVRLLFRLPPGWNSSLLARLPGLFNVLAGHLSLFGKGAQEASAEVLVSTEPNPSIDEPPTTYRPSPDDVLSEPRPMEAPAGTASDLPEDQPRENTEPQHINQEENYVIL